MGIQIRLAHDASDEARAAAALLQVLGDYDLSRWIFTDDITVDNSIIGSSHPLTLGPKYLLLGGDSALAVFVHEQLHWLTASSDGMSGAKEEVKERWPDPPSFPDGAMDAESTWLHFIVCSLEYKSLLELVGKERANSVLQARYGYRWIYKTILEDWPWFDDFLKRYGFQIPELAPQPSRFEEKGKTIHLGGDLSSLELATGNPRELQVAELIKDYFEEYSSLKEWNYTDRVRVEAMVPPSFASPTINTFYLDKPLGLLAMWLDVQFGVYLNQKDERDVGSLLHDLQAKNLLGETAGVEDARSLAIFANEFLALRKILSEKNLEEALSLSFASRIFPWLPTAVDEITPMLSDHGLLAVDADQRSSGAD